jgi:glycerol-3-phosphate acyltransferase PlsY
VTALMFIAVAVIGYLLGSIPCGVIIGKWFAKTDVREIGSGKIGMTNVMRAAGRKAAVVSLIMDIVKGVLAVVFAMLIFRNTTDTVAVVLTLNKSAQVLAGFAAITGHSWSIFLKFKGGRGVATFMGGLAALYWPAAVVGAAFLFGIGFRTKYMSLGSIIGAVTAFIMLMSLYVLKIDFLQPYPPFECVLYAMFGSIFIYVMHRDNILRLFNGTERKIGEKSKAKINTSTDIPKKIYR